MHSKLFTFIFCQNISLQLRKLNNKMTDLMFTSLLYGVPGLSTIDKVAIRDRLKMTKCVRYFQA